VNGERRETFGVGCGFDLVHELEIGKVVDVDLVLQRNDDLVPSQLHSFMHSADHKTERTVGLGRDVRRRGDEKSTHP